MDRNLRLVEPLFLVCGVPYPYRVRRDPVIRKGPHHNGTLQLLVDSVLKMSLLHYGETFSH